MHWLPSFSLAATSYYVVRSTYSVLVSSAYPWIHGLKLGDDVASSMVSQLCRDLLVMFYRLLCYYVVELQVIHSFRYYSISPCSAAAPSPVA